MRPGDGVSQRTRLLLRKYNLEPALAGDRATLLAQIAAVQTAANAREHEHALAELAYLGAEEAKAKDPARAAELYGAALLHTNRFLFDPRLPGDCNPYDPQFRATCDLYNQSLEGFLRLSARDHTLQPGTQGEVSVEGRRCRFDVAFYSNGWHAEDLDRFEFVSDYRVTGLRNHFHTFGLGVPLIGIRRPHDCPDPAEHFYPAQLSFPLTAFMRIEPGEPAGPDAPPRFVLELHDPLDRGAVAVGEREAPLESDLSTPLAYFLEQPALRDNRLSTLGLLDPASVQSLQGLYMLEPYHPHKMPVLMVHGLWSSPVTWMEMFNDLRSDPEVRKRYQFWFYLYPTGQPFWASAAQLRDDLARLREAVDPGRRAPALDQMVLVGHSMGGLVSRMQCVDSGRDFWRANSDRSFADLQADPDTRELLASTYFFRPSTSVRRVITIGSPHRGSKFSNGFTQFVGRKLISSPIRLVAGRHQVLSRNPGYFRPGSAIEVRTSIESLATDSPLLTPLLAAPPAPWVRVHNIAGRTEDQKFQFLLGEPGDGVVSLASASLEGFPQVDSEVVVPADHLTVHRHPQSIFEVRRILLLQAEELENLPYGGPQGGWQNIARLPPAEGAPAPGALR